MSGGFWDYKNDSLYYNLFGYFEPNDDGDYNDDNDYEIGRNGKIFESETLNKILKDMLELLHERDYNLCGDIRDETYIESEKKILKKWNLEESK